MFYGNRTIKISIRGNSVVKLRHGSHFEGTVKKTDVFPEPVLAHEVGLKRNLHPSIAPDSEHWAVRLKKGRAGLYYPFRYTAAAAVIIASLL